MKYTFGTDVRYIYYMRTSVPCQAIFKEIERMFACLLELCYNGAMEGDIDV